MYCSRVIVESSRAPYDLARNIHGMHLVPVRRFLLQARCKVPGAWIFLSTEFPMHIVRYTGKQPGAHIDHHTQWSVG
jgi:hypothetical protein